MATVSESQLSRWTQPGLDNEDEKSKNTERMIREAINGHPLLKTLPIAVYAKGSYRNNTNVRQDSDVDVAVEYEGIVFSEYGPDTSQREVRQARGTSAYSGPFLDDHGQTDMAMFKRAIEHALVEAFGRPAVTRHNKVFTVRESRRSLAADVVPCGTYRKYWSPTRFHQGIQLLPDRPPGHRIVNYPQQHYDEGVSKNLATSKRFKCVVRILKNLENHMVDQRTCAEVASYLIESLVFNAPNSCFLNSSTWGERTRAVLLHAWQDTEEAECEKRWMEVNDIKYLFHRWQKWDRIEARTFVKAAWQYVERT